MASELENALKNVANQIATYVGEAAQLRVETRIIEIAPGDNQGGVPVAPNIPEKEEKPGKLAAMTSINLDGDNVTALPIQKTTGDRWEVDTELFEIHQRNVTTAIEYRSSILNALLGLLQPRNRQL